MPPTIPAAIISGMTQKPCAFGQSEGDARARKRADDVLPLGADVPDLGLIAERQAERDDDERRRLGRDVLPLVGGDDRA